MLFIILLLLIVVNVYHKKTGKYLLGSFLYANNLFIAIYALFVGLLTFFPQHFELGNAFYFFILFVVVEYFTKKTVKKQELFLFLFLGGLKFFIVDIYSTPTPSLVPTINVGDRYVFTKTNFGIKLPFMNEMIIQWDEPKRQDIVIFHYKDKETGKVTPYMKRVIGVEGDTVVYDFVNKTLEVTNKDGEVLKTNYELVGLEENNTSKKFVEKNKEAKHYIYTTDYEPEIMSEDKVVIYGQVLPKVLVVKLEKGEMFVMGDNRDRSIDSRFFGAVKTSSLTGKIASFHKTTVE